MLKLIFQIMQQRHKGTKALTAVKNKIPDVNILVKKTD